eukprot:TRINITY_DN3709_c1_g1_i6.p1 TRINITY_DN3709_c1_g1~~TRINITY_DN3709_c1_g1_i6.p1  ORF type:complete len:483 (-),score=154.51 TRINITY_DN3709_c1_g1_i6:222-1670(-)
MESHFDLMDNLQFPFSENLSDERRPGSRTNSVESLSFNFNEHHPLETSPRGVPPEQSSPYHRPVSPEVVDKYPMIPWISEEPPEPNLSKSPTLFGRSVSAPVLPSMTSSSNAPPHIALTEYYPPLPSYERESATSPSLFNSVPAFSQYVILDSNQPKLSDEAQMMLHSGSSPSSPIHDMLSHVTPVEGHVTPTSDHVTSSPAPTVPTDHASNSPIDVSGNSEISPNDPSNSSPFPMPSGHLSPLASRRRSHVPNDETPHLSLLFLQFQHFPFSDARPKLLKDGDGLDRALNVLDRIKSTETHKIGVLYVGAGQNSSDEILSNQTGSQRYHQFLGKIGKLVALKDVVDDMYVGGLDPDDHADGEYCLVYKDITHQVVFHVATLMPNLPSDKAFTNKKRHIGNDNVIIIYSDSKSSYNQDTITGQFNFVNIVIYPLEKGFYQLEVKKKAEVPDFGPITSIRIVTEEALVPLIRYIALNADVLSI